MRLKSSTALGYFLRFTVSFINGLLIRLFRFSCRFSFKLLRRRLVYDSELEYLLSTIAEHLFDGDVQLNRDLTSVMRNFIKMNSQTIDLIMVPRADIEAVDVTCLTSLLPKHNVLPVFKGNLDNVIGYVNALELLHSKENCTVIDKILFAPSLMRILSLFLKMCAEKTYIAIVVDEYGGTDGLVTITDIFRLLTSGISSGIAGDSYSRNDVVFLGDGRFKFHARAYLTEVEEITKLSLKDSIDDDIDTLGGLVLNIAGCIPRNKQIIRHPNQKVEFVIISATHTQIQEIMLCKLQ